MPGARIVIDLTEAATTELDRLINTTGMESRVEVFRRALTLLRLHIGAAASGHEIRLVDLKQPDNHRIISLPFRVEDSPNRQSLEDIC